MYFFIPIFSISNVIASSIYIPFTRGTSHPVGSIGFVNKEEKSLTSLMMALLAVDII